MAVEEANANRMNNDTFIGYCQSHCKTPRALFHVDDVRRAYGLAGLTDKVIEMFEWLSMHEEMERLCVLARSGMIDNGTLRIWHEQVV